MKSKFVSYYGHNSLHIGAINLKNKTLSISIESNFEVFDVDIRKNDLSELIEILKIKLRQINYNYTINLT